MCFCLLRHMLPKYFVHCMEALYCIALLVGAFPECQRPRNMFFLCILMHGLRSVDHLLMDLGYARHAAKFVNS